jgi:DUF971 family protein
MSRPHQPPENIALIGTMVAINWPDGREDFLPMELLRAWSPSAENMGEPDIFGNIHGADPRTEFPGVTVDDYAIVGNYAIRFSFSDGHRTGLFTFPYLKRIGDQVRQGEDG